MFVLTVSLTSLASTTGYTADEIETAARTAWDVLEIDSLGIVTADVEFVTGEAQTSARGSIQGDDSGAESERACEELVSRFADAFTAALAAFATSAAPEITDAQIEALRDEAGEAGDLAQVAICDIALGAAPAGHAAIALARNGFPGVVLRKYADDVDGARVVFVDEAEAIAREDASLIYLSGGDRSAACAACARVIADARAMA